jgi:hypothetical protein
MAPHLACPPPLATDPAPRGTHVSRGPRRPPRMRARKGSTVWQERAAARSVLEGPMVRGWPCPVRPAVDLVPRGTRVSRGRRGTPCPSRRARKGSTVWQERAAARRVLQGPMVRRRPSPVRPAVDPAPRGGMVPSAACHPHLAVDPALRGTHVSRGPSALRPLCVQLVSSVWTERAPAPTAARVCTAARRD